MCLLEGISRQESTPVVAWVLFTTLIPGYSEKEQVGQEDRKMQFVGGKGLGIPLAQAPSFTSL